MLVLLATLVFLVVLLSWSQKPSVLLFVACVIVIAFLMGGVEGFGDIAVGCHIAFECHTAFVLGASH